MSKRRMVWIGCGRHAEQMLLPQLMRHDVELVGVCDLNAEVATRVGKRYGVAHIATDHRELLALSGVDVVGMAAGPVAHRDLSIAALQRGCHVFMEKPCGANAADAQAIADAAAAAGRTVGVGFMKRYSTANRIAYNVVKSAEFGAVAGFFGEYMTAPTYFAGNVDYTGFYLHHCVHYMDLVRYFVAPVAQVTVFRNEIAPGKLLLHVHFGFANGAIGTVLLGTLQSRGTPMERLQIMGDHRRVEVNGVIEVEYFRNPPFKADDPVGVAVGRRRHLELEAEFHRRGERRLQGLQRLVRRVLRAPGWSGDRSADDCRRGARDARAGGHDHGGVTARGGGRRCRLRPL